ncbi:MAG: DUF6624 domain-containing protein [Massilia sp.]
MMLGTEANAPARKWKSACLLLGGFALCLPMLAQAASCQDIDQRLNALASADQQVRQDGENVERDAGATAAEKAAMRQRWREVDLQNLKQLKAIIADCGWPGSKKGSHSAWLLAQHADSDLAFQHLALSLLAASVTRGVADPKDLAYLADRIASNEHRPQEYGTQFMQTDRCHLELLPVDKVELVTRRRLAIGLSSLDAYQREMRERFVATDCQAGDPPAR